MEVDWTQLLPELIEIISKNLKQYTDYLNIRSVCYTWRISVPRTPRHLPPQFPCLLLSHPRRRRFIFYNLLTHKTRHVTNLPDTSPPKRCRFSSQGWLFVLDDSPDILLLNPLTRMKLTLPPITAFPNVVAFSFNNVGREYVINDSLRGVYSRSLREIRDCFIKKVVLSCSPMQNEEFVVMVILGHCGNLAFCKNGGSCWSIVDAAGSFFEDVIYRDGLFYAVNKHGVVAVCDVRGDVPSVSVIDTPRMFSGDLQYLVSSGDGLLLVTRYLDIVTDAYQDHLTYRTSRFEMFRLDLDGPWWKRVTSLGDTILFIGENSSLSLSASDFQGIRGDCIYYTDDYSELNYDGVYGEHDSGIFCLGNRSIEPLPCFSSPSAAGLQWPSPLWVSLNPC